MPLSTVTRPPSQGVRGFTLIEAVVALTILSLVMLVTVTALRTFGNTQVALERRATEIDEIRSVSSFLRDLFESAVVGRDAGALTTGGGSREVTHFRHNRDYVELKSTILFGESYGGSYLVRLVQEGSALVLRWQEAIPGGVVGDWGDSPSRVLIPALEEFAVRTKTEYGDDWLAGSDTGDMPALVRMQIKSGGRHWPDLILKVQR